MMKNYPFFEDNWLERKSYSLTWWGIAIYCLIFIAGSFWKYFHFGYNALDLGIYNQVFFNTGFGRLFAFTIHPHSYLGDHLELFILFLAPLYALFKNPLSLLVLQTAAIGLSAWPLYLIGKKLKNGKLGLLMAVLFLANPFVQNINYFEFHLLPFAIPLVFLAFYFYLTKRFFLFVLFSLSGLLVREDVALVIIMFFLLALLEKRRLKWIITPAVISIAWFTGAILLISKFNNYHSYKFIFYYSWLGNSLSEIATNLFLKPLTVLAHVFSAQNIIFSVALFLPFILLPFLKPKYLLLSFLVFLQVILGSFAGELVLKTHYSSLVLTAVFIATAFALAYLCDNNSAGTVKYQKAVKFIIQKNQLLFWSILIAVTLYSGLTFGPLLPLARDVIVNPTKQETELKNNFLKFIPNNASVTASFEFLTKLSGRERIYSGHYAFTGKKQYSDEDYLLPPTDYLVLDTKDFLTYQTQYENNTIYPEAYAQGDGHIRSIIKTQGLGLTKATDTLLVYQKGVANLLKIYDTFPPAQAPTITNPQSTAVAPGINFLGWNNLPVSEINNPKFDLSYTPAPLTLFWRARYKIEKNYQLIFTVKNDNGQIIYRKYYPLAYGIYPSHAWLPDEIVQTNYWFLIPLKFAGEKNKISLQLAEIKNNNPYMGLNGMLTAVLKKLEYLPVGKEILIPLKY